VDFSEPTVDRGEANKKSRGKMRDEGAEGKGMRRQKERGNGEDFCVQWRKTGVPEKEVGREMEESDGEGGKTACLAWVK
jgi:hypothetical protein